MTGRQLITVICDTTQDLDAEIPVSIVYCDEHQQAIGQRKVNAFTFINGKLCIEGNCLGDYSR